MNLSSIPTVSLAISIIICWGLFAMFCSFIQELMAQVVSERGRFMKNYMLRQLNDLPNEINWGNALYQQGIITMLSRDIRKPTNDIDPTLFAQALIGAVGGSHLVQTKEQALHTPVSTESETLLAEISRYKNPALAHFKAAILLLRPSEQVSLFKTAMSGAETRATQADGSLDEKRIFEYLTTNLEKWYEELMQRMTLWYKKKTRTRLFLLGIVLGLYMNVDSIDLFNKFNITPSAREVVIQYYNQQPGHIADKDTAAFRKDVDKLIHEAYLPVGTSFNVFHQRENYSVHYFFLKFLGVLISGLAASFGGPFWFDVLKRIYTPKSK